MQIFPAARCPGKSEGPAASPHRHCEGRLPRGNLRHDVSVRLAPINIVRPGFSMLIYISAHPTAVPEIATPLLRLAMTERDGGWSRFAGSAVVIAERTAERHEGRSLHWFVPVGRAALPPPGRYDDRPVKTEGPVLRPPPSLRAAKAAWQSPPPQSDALKCRLTWKTRMFDVNRCIQDGYMVLEIATPWRARNDRGGRWLVPFRRSGVIIDGVYRFQNSFPRGWCSRITATMQRF